MRGGAARVRGWLAASHRPAAYARSGLLAVALFGFTLLQWHLFEPRPGTTPLEPALELLVIVAAVGGVVTFDFLRSSPEIYRPLIAGFAFVGVTGTADLMDDLVYQSVAFSVVFEHLAFVLAVGAILTAVGRWAEERDERELELRRRNERLDTFASVASHELRNPLQVARGSVDAVRAGDDGEALDRLERAIDRMDDIVDDVWAFSNVGVEHVDLRPIDLSTAADAAWVGVDADGTALVVERDGTVRADPGLVEQALENLFEDCVDRGSEVVRVGCTPAGFQVTGERPAVDSDESARVFDPRDDDRTVETDFGLAIVRRIVEAHGWSIETVTGDERTFEIRTE